MQRGDKVRYMSSAPKYDPLHGLTGKVTHLHGDHDYRGSSKEVWVEWDDKGKAPCWVAIKDLKLVP